MYLEPSARDENVVTYNYFFSELELRLGGLVTPGPYSCQGWACKER